MYFCKLLKLKLCIFIINTLYKFMLQHMSNSRGLSSLGLSLSVDLHHHLANPSVIKVSMIL